MISPGATLGLLGGGQLGRMFTAAARRMGYEVLVLDPDPLSPAGTLANRHIQAAYQDEGALRQMGETAAAVTTEFENVPAASLEFLRRFLLHLLPKGFKRIRQYGILANRKHRQMIQEARRLLEEQGKTINHDPVTREATDGSTCPACGKGKLRWTELLPEMPLEPRVYCEPAYCDSS